MTSSCAKKPRPMKQLADVNLLLALVVERHAQHAAVRVWWSRRKAEGPVYLCRSVQASFLRLLTTSAVMGDETLTLPQAWGCYAQLLNSGHFALALEPTGLDATWAGLCQPFGRSPKVVMDAYLAAFAVTGSYELLTLDRAFAQFPGLTWRRPE